MFYLLLTTKQNVSFSRIFTMNYKLNQENVNLIMTEQRIADISNGESTVELSNIIFHNDFFCHNGTSTGYLSHDNV